MAMIMAWNWPKQQQKNLHLNSINRHFFLLNTTLSFLMFREVIYSAAVNGNIWKCTCFFLCIYGDCISVTRPCMHHFNVWVTEENRTKLSRSQQNTCKSGNRYGGNHWTTCLIEIVHICILAGYCLSVTWFNKWDCGEMVVNAMPSLDGDCNQLLQWKTMHYILCTIRQMVTKVRHDEKLCLGPTLMSQNPIWQAVSSIWQLCIVVKERIAHPECKARCSIFVTKPSWENSFLSFFVLALTALLSFTQQQS